MRIFFLITIVFLIVSDLYAQNGFTQKDRELLIELKVKMGEMDKRFEQRFQEIDKRFEQVDKRFEQVDKRFEQVDKRFEELREDMNKRFEQILTFLWIISGIFTALVVALIGFLFWDRRTLIEKAEERVIKKIEKEGRLIDLIGALRELAKSNPEIAKVLKQFNLL